MGNIYNRLFLCKALINRELTCCKKIVRHLALRKLLSAQPIRIGDIYHILFVVLFQFLDWVGVNSHSKIIYLPKIKT